MPFLNTEENQNWINRLYYVGFAFVWAIAYDILFWHHRLGLNFFLFVAIYVVGFIALLIKSKRLLQTWSLILALAAVILSVAPLIYQNDMVSVGVPFFVFILLLLFSLIAPIVNPLKFPFYFGKIPVLSELAERSPLSISALYKDIFSSSNLRQVLLKRILAGFLIAIPLVVVFGALFYRADEVFADWVRSFNIESADLWRVIRTVIMTALLSSLWYRFLVGKYELAEKKSFPRKEDAVIVSIVLGVLNLLFGIFVFIQFNYLFAGKEYIFSQASVTYASYARQGFFELLTVIALAGLIILTTYRAFVAHGRHLAVNLLQVLLIGQVVVVAVSAIKRLNLYQDAYGFTVLRLYSEWFVYFMIAMLAGSALAILLKISFRSYLHKSLLLGLVALIVVANVNVDLRIASRNVDRFLNENKTLDTVYLESLSADAAAPIALLYKTISKDDFRTMEAQISLLGYWDRAVATSTRDWRDFNFSDEMERAEFAKVETNVRSLQARKKDFKE